MAEHRTHKHPHANSSSGQRKIPARAGRFIADTEIMRSFDRESAEIVPEMILMEQAGTTMANELLRDVQKAAGYQAFCILAGPGHNGGDALVLARHIIQAGYQAEVFYRPPSKEDPLVSRMLRALDTDESRVRILNSDPNDESWDRFCDFLDTRKSEAFSWVLVDGFLGSGISRPLYPLNLGPVNHGPVNHGPVNHGPVNQSAANTEKQAADHSSVNRGKENTDHSRGLQRLCALWNSWPGKRYALDVPSGSGEQASSDWPILKADVTLGVQFPRRFLFRPAFRELAGEIRTITIGFPLSRLERVYASYPDSSTSSAKPEFSQVDDPGLSERISLEMLQQLVPPLPSHAHKGVRGKVEVYAGSEGMSGAARLSASAALHASAGLVKVYNSNPNVLESVSANEAALMTGTLPDQSFQPGEWGSAALAGPGWGRGADQRSILTSLAQSPIPLLLDADALRLLASDTAVREILAGRSPALVLTPHPGEAAALLNRDLKKILHDPLQSAAEIARIYEASVVITSSLSYLADPQGRSAVLDAPNPALGTAGSGDCLAGIGAALLGRGLEAWDALRAAVLIHSEAGRRSYASLGFFSSTEMLPPISRILGELQYRGVEV